MSHTPVNLGTTAGKEMMFKLFFLLIVVCKIQDGNGRDSGVSQCGPQNVTLTSSDHHLVVRWEDGPSCSASQGALTYELVVLAADKEVLHQEVPLTPDLIGSVHSWSWTPHLAVECVSHSVKLRSRSNNHTSPWKQVQTAPVTQRGMKVFPRDRVFEAGSEATFCCVLPAGERLDRMFLNGYDGGDAKATLVSDRTYALTLRLNHSRPQCVDVLCKTSKTSYGACTFIGYPPDDRDLQCETRDLESVECYWAVGRDTNLSLKSPTKYLLNGRPCKEASKGRCSQHIQVEAGERNWTLQAHNKLGSVELHHRADLTTRVRMFPPEGLRALSVSARHISLTWTWTVERYKLLHKKCQAIDAETGTLIETSGTGNDVLHLNNLTPNWSYRLRVRCGTAQHFWKWGDWSQSIVVHTQGDVPEPLDVWMQMKGNKTVVLWKRPLANQSHGEILDYQVSWRKTMGKDQPHRLTVPPSSLSLTLGLDPSDQHTVTVTARNRNGTSAPSTVIVPTYHPVKPSRIVGTDSSFLLSWSAHAAASCGYIVDWSSAYGNDSVEWLRVPPNHTDVRIRSENFKDGLRYSLSVSACTRGAPVLLQRMEGYVRETRIQSSLFESLKFKQRGLDVEVTWDPVPLTELTAFIRGYALYYQDADGPGSRVSTNDSTATSLTAADLKVALYNFTVTAVTSAGECCHKSFTASVTSQTDNLILPVSISLGVLFVLLSLATVLCYKHWACIKQKVYPPIPTPVLTEKWSTSSEHSHCLVLDQSYHSEADVPDVPELHCKPGLPWNAFVHQDDKWIAFTQTSMSYIQQETLQEDVPQPLVLPATATSPQPALPPFPDGGLFPNPSYNLIMQTDIQPGSASPEVQEESPNNQSLDGYQPQSTAEPHMLLQTEEDPPSPMSFSSTYILLPSST